MIPGGNYPPCSMLPAPQVFNTYTEQLDFGATAVSSWLAFYIEVKGIIVLDWNADLSF